MELGIATQVMLISAVLAVILGAVVNKTNFCTMGAVSDWVNMGDGCHYRSVDLRSPGYIRYGHLPCSLP
jgi:hypothetical protein